MWYLDADADGYGNQLTLLNRVLSLKGMLRSIRIVTIWTQSETPMR